MYQHRHLLWALWEITAREWQRKPQKLDIERLLTQAQREVERQYAGNREQTIRAITQKNNVLQLVYNLKYQRDRCEDIAIEQDTVKETQNAALVLHTHLTLEELDWTRGLHACGP